jgi:ribonuclease-3 family protein
MIIRTVVISRADRSAKQLHRTTIQYVSAVAQSKIYDVLAAGDNGSGSDLLNDEELAFMKRGRNAGPAATSRNATAAEYRKATGLEALMGYLYLTGQTERAVELARIGLEKAGLEI